MSGGQIDISVVSETRSDTFPVEGCQEKNRLKGFCLRVNINILNRNLLFFFRNPFLSLTLNHKVTNWLTIEMDAQYKV